MDGGGMVKAKGAVEYFDLGDITGLEALAGFVLGLNHVGWGLSQKWERQTDGLKIREARRIRTLVQEFGEADLREVYAEEFLAAEMNRLQLVEQIEKAKKPIPERLLEPFSVYLVITTEEGKAERLELVKSAVADCVLSLAGPLYAEPLTDPSEIVSELERFGAVLAAGVKAKEVQRLTAAQFPVAPDLGDARPGGAVAGG